VRPSTWAKYATASIVIKILRDKEPARLEEHISQTLFYERRQPGILKFYDASRNKIGRQCIGNRLKETFDVISTPFNLNETNDTIRIRLKRALGFPGSQQRKPPTNDALQTKDELIPLMPDETPTGPMVAKFTTDDEDDGIYIDILKR